MKLKRYKAKTEYEAMEEIKKELGDQAIIMNTKKVKPKGFFGFLKKHEYEILVGIEEKRFEPSIKAEDFESLLKDNLETKRELQDIKECILQMSKNMQGDTEDDRADKKEFKKEGHNEKKRKSKNSSKKNVNDKISKKKKKPNQKESELDIALSADFDDDIEYYEDLLDKYCEQEEEYEKNAKFAHEKEKIEEDEEENEEFDEDFGEEDDEYDVDDKYDKDDEDYIDEKAEKKEGKIKKQPLYKKLLSKGVHEDLAKNICDLVLKQLNGKDASEEQINRLAKIVIKNILGQPYQIPTDKKKQSIFFFIGPTGVGKTTTIAKIATKLSFIEGRDLALITTDTFRIAAVEQLKVYGDILNLPISVVYKPLEFEEVLHKYEDKEIIMIDTAGKSHLDNGMEEYISSYLEMAPDSEKFLLISLTTSYRDIESIVDAYGFLDDYKIIFTKIDEASQTGNILNIKEKTSRDTSFITNGQSVPDDIIVADPDEIAEIILGD